MISQEYDIVKGEKGENSSSKYTEGLLIKN